jgi:hypothetical protein
MRLTAALALLLAIPSLTACKKAIAQNPTLEERVAALQAQVDTLTQQLAEVKVPHLVVAATGEDLGPYVDSPHIGGYGVVMETPQFTGVLSLGAFVQLSFSGPDCTGSSVAYPISSTLGALPGVPLADTAFISPDGRLITVSGPVRTVPSQSYRPFDGSTSCINAQRPDATGFDYSPTGLTGRRYDPQDVTITVF